MQMPNLLNLLITLVGFGIPNLATRLNLPLPTLGSTCNIPTRQYSRAAEDNEQQHSHKTPHARGSMTTLCHDGTVVVEFDVSLGISNSNIDGHQ